MKNLRLLKCILALATLAVFGFAFSRNNWGKVSRVAVQNGGDNDTRTLKEKARQAQRFTGEEPANMASRYLDLEQLAAHSGAVLIGTAQKNVCRLSPDGRRATIDYSVNIEYVLKGNNKAGNTITVSLPGGSVAFPDGSSAEIRTPWFKKMQEGTTYLLFLNDAGGAGSYVTTGQAQGVWEIPTGTTTRTIKAHTGIMNDPMWKYQNMDVKAFLKEVRKATHKSVKG